MPPEENQQQVIDPGDGQGQYRPDPSLAQQSEQETPEPPQKPPRRRRSLKRLLLFPAVLLVVGLVLFAVPATRYKILSLFIKKDISVVALDSETGRPVSNADVVLDGRKAVTDAEGMVSFSQLSSGNKDLKITKKYYKDYTGSALVDPFKDNQNIRADMEATGRQVLISVSNRINGKPLSDVSVRAADTEVKTDKEGQATIVLPADSEKEEATFQIDSYNGLVAEIIVNEPSPNQNQFALTPSGKVFFLSKRSGTIDIVKANLDGSGRETVLAGTGNEQDFNTTMLASSDWRYLLLRARREAGNPKLYLIDTQNESRLVTVDNAAGEYLPIGWSGDKFVYRLDRDISPWLRGRYSLRYFDASKAKITKVDESAAGGTDNYFSYFETLDNIIVLKDQIVYSKAWSAYRESSITDEKSGIFSAKFDGSKPKALKKFAAPKVDFISAKAYKPNQVYFAVNRTDGNVSYFDYGNNKLKTSGIDANSFNRSFPTYLVSPDNKSAFWTESRDGQSVLFAGKSDATEEKVVAELNGFKAYGWFKNDYLLATKSGHELYIIAPEPDSKPLKIDDYHSSPFEALGQSYTYGGL